jgi:putative resolvase
MKLSDYAKQQGIRYETAWRWFRDGKIKGRRVGAHTILIEEERPSPAGSLGQVAVYTRVSSSENKSNLDSQAERLVAYCAARGYQVSKVVNQAENSTEDLLADLTSIIYSFCARLYGQRRAKRKTEKIVQELEDTDATG